MPGQYRKISATAELKGTASSTRTEIRNPMVQPRITSTSIAPNTKLEPSTRNMIEISSDVSRVAENPMNGYCCFSSSTRALIAWAVP